MNNRKNLRRATDLAAAMGYELVRLTSDGHALFKNKDGVTVTAGLSRSDPRAIKNFIADLRRGARRDLAQTALR